MLLRVDLADFFPSLSGARVQAVFRTLGYPEPVADLLGGICTTTSPGRVFAGASVDACLLAKAKRVYLRPHLPQGAPTSPALANLCAFGWIVDSHVSDWSALCTRDTLMIWRFRVVTTSHVVPNT